MVTLSRTYLPSCHQYESTSQEVRQGDHLGNELRPKMWGSHSHCWYIYVSRRGQGLVIFVDPDLLTQGFTWIPRGLAAGKTGGGVGLGDLAVDFWVDSFRDGGGETGGVCGASGWRH
jgi:hypothetical protein